MKNPSNPLDPAYIALQEEIEALKQELEVCEVYEKRLFSKYYQALFAIDRIELELKQLRKNIGVEPLECLYQGEQQ